MKSFTRILAAVATMLFAGSSMAAITGSAHDLTSAAAGYSQTSTNQICVFCHTPHSGNPILVAPLWNKATQASGAYTAYTSSTMQGTSVVSGISLACLSCHDGAQAMDSMYNTPGSGTSVSGVSAVYAFAAASAGGDAIGGGNTMGASSPAMLGVDLTNDHPVGMEYAGGNGVWGAALAAGAGSDTGFFGTTGTVTNTLALPLYEDIATQQIVTCATCHDVHGTANPTFLRASNANSAVCLACHNK